MKVITKLNVMRDVALVTLNKVPANVDFICKIFDRLDEEGINVDMISQSPLTGSYVSVSFTASSDDMVKIAKLANEINVEYPSVRPLLSHNNVKISLYGEDMPKYHGIAASVFRVLQQCGTDVLMITTSSVDISVLVGGAYSEQCIAALTEAFDL
jgi:aspartokinase